LENKSTVELEDFKKSDLRIALVFFLYLFIHFSTHFAAASADNAEQFKELKDRISELEVSNALDKFKFSGVLTNYYENLRNNHGPVGSKSQDNISAYSLYFGLNIDVNVSKNLKIYSTFAMSKFYNNEGRRENLTSNNYTPYAASETGGWGLGGSTLRLDRAYGSYEFDTLPLTLAAGRIPTNGGPPMNQLDGLPRQGTYPRFSFNSIFDGISAVVNLSSFLPKDHSLKLRMFYQPFTVIDTGDRTLQFVDGNKLNSSTPEWVVLTEYSLKNTKFFDSLDLMYMHTEWYDFYNGYSTGSPATLGQTPNGGLESGGQNTFYVGLENIASIGLNLSWSGMLLRTIDTSEPGFQQNSFNHLLNINEQFSFLGNMVLGYEYIRTTPGYYLDEWTRMNSIPFYILENAVGHHIYASVPITQRIIGRIGYYRLNAGVGDIFQTQESDDSSWYAQVRMSF
jgi:hypothetical protein